jgi:hypothetical protein
MRVNETKERIMAIKGFQASRRLGNASTYVCRTCKHNTRNVGGDEMDVRLCFPCYELSGIHNLQSDSFEEAKQYVQEIKDHIAAIESRGKGDSGWRQKFVRLIG